VSSLDSSVAGVHCDPVAELPARGRPSYLEKGVLHDAAKRAFDLAAVVLALLLVLPIFALLAALIRLDSRGPVFYRQTRVGLRRRPFRIWKFRKMRNDLPSQGPMLTMRHDYRMTRVGRFLERTKLDELPQLINVLVGEMSIVGPRPEVPRFVEFYPDRWDQVLSVKPGIFGASQNHFRNESELYPPRVADVEGFYLERILPEMLELDARYAREATLLRDVWLLIGGVVTSFAGTVTRRTVRAIAVPAAMLVALTGVVVLAMAVAHAVRGVESSAGALALSAAVGAVSLLAFRVPRTHVTSLTPDDARRLLYCAAASTAAVAGVAWALDVDEPDAAVIIVFGLTLLAGLFCFRTLSYLLHVWLAETGPLPRRLFCAAFVLAPASLALVVTSVHGLRGWRADEGAYAAMAGLLLFVRPSLLLLARPPATRPGAARWLRHELLHLAVPIAVGSCLAVAAVDVALDARIARREVALDAVAFATLMLAFGVWQNRRLSHPSTPLREPSATRFLVVGAGVELAAYLAALATLRPWSIAGVVTPDSGPGRSYVSGQRILGSVGDLPEILAAQEVDTLLVLVGSIDHAARTDVEKAATATGVEVSAVRFLPVPEEADVRRAPARLAVERGG
jgi:lipopolysaccharide/colanic/teichoic acid biosynthesis glycosyltransferase